MPRETLTWVLAAMLALLIVTTAFAAPPAMVFQNETVRIQLENEPCLSAAVLGRIQRSYHGFFQSGSAKWAGRAPVALCWMVLDDGSVFVMDEAGDYGVLPSTIFRRVSHV